MRQWNAGRNDSRRPDESQATSEHLALSTLPTNPPKTEAITLSGLLKRSKTNKRPIPDIPPPPRPTMTAKAWKDGTPPPEFIINLDLPPTQRWAEAVNWGTKPLQDMVSKIQAPTGAYVWENEIMRHIERRYSFSNEQYEEMQGISAVSGIPFHMIMEYNLGLNSQFGCTSGTVPLIHSKKLLHFRALDPTYAMPHLLIQAHFVRRDELVASALMHLGHVAIVTGVRQGLSISLNTRDSYDRFEGVQKFVTRLSWALWDPWFITIRDLLLRERLPSLRTAKRELTSGHPEASFAVISDGTDAAALDVRWKDGSIWRDTQNGVLVQGNHYADGQKNEVFLSAMMPGYSQRTTRSQNRVYKLKGDIDRSMQRSDGAGAKLPDVISWISSQPVRHDVTTLACVMDPTEGDIIWSAAYRGRS
ncbi:hypothetical protein M408DRAFT_330644 [Serendipita vermifera MAFF 305830]|uniref:ceramidase n=1 Tax=Serendipita vermifera MAFF 305830 TaxID=933852 RepID=A0A0C3B448_SERVB|nr:hypothetical protein M408DRAFT_330644 [Serendipita vermifera MAFF 305830]